MAEIEGVGVSWRGRLSSDITIVQNKEEKTLGAVHCLSLAVKLPSSSANVLTYLTLWSTYQGHVRRQNY